FLGGGAQMALQYSIACMSVFSVSVGIAVAPLVAAVIQVVFFDLSLSLSFFNTCFLYGFSDFVGYCSV
ncbi:hypothetical protein, partial [Pseudomonas asplenii]|uniref:hypothetical protein n=1 Tax=Pseudomonas asplenii TaxID=53407 RepID=UPI001E2B1133